MCANCGAGPQSIEQVSRIPKDGPRGPILYDEYHRPIASSAPEGEDANPETDEEAQAESKRDEPHDFFRIWFSFALAVLGAPFVVWRVWDHSHATALWLAS